MGSAVCRARQCSSASKKRSFPVQNSADETTQADSAADRYLRPPRHCWSSGSVPPPPSGHPHRRRLPLPSPAIRPPDESSHYLPGHTEPQPAGASLAIGQSRQQRLHCFVIPGSRHALAPDGDQAAVGSEDRWRQTGRQSRRFPVYRSLFRYSPRPKRVRTPIIAANGNASKTPTNPKSVPKANNAKITHTGCN